MAVIPQIEIFGATITEPMTTATDFLITAFTFWFAAQLLTRQANRDHLSRRHWGLAFIFLGLGALFGGANHGFAAYLQQDWLDLIWKGALYSLGFAMFFMLIGTVSGSVRNRTWRIFLYGYSAVACAVFIGWSIDHDDFVYAVLNNLSTFVIIIVLQVSALIRYRAESAKWILSGVAVSLLSAGIQRSGFDLHVHFNHNDLYHVVQIVGLYLFYRGASVLQDFTGSESSASRLRIG